jgi:uncharacterized membrane protein
VLPGVETGVPVGTVEGSWLAAGVGDAVALPAVPFPVALSGIGISIDCPGMTVKAGMFLTGSTYNGPVELFAFVEPFV